MADVPEVRVGGHVTVNPAETSGVGKNNMMKTLAAFLALVALSAAPSHSQDVATGPSAGASLTPVMAYGAGGVYSGPYAGREFDAVKVIGEGPGALLFIHELTRNILPVIRGVDQAGSEYSVMGFKSFTLMLSPDRTAAESRLKAANGSLKLRNPIVLNLDGAEGPGNYALNRKAALSLILVNKGKVVRTHAFTDVNQKDESLVRGWIEEMTGPIPTNPNDYRKLVEAQLPKDGEALRAMALNQAVEIHQLHARLKRLQEQSGGRYGMAPNRQNTRKAKAPQMRPEAGRGEGRPKAGRGGARPRDKAGEGDVSRPATTQRQGKAPEDPQLNNLLRSFIRQTNENSQSNEIFADIQARAKESDALRGEAVEMFKLMLSYRDRYGSKHAQTLAEGFLKEHAPTKKER